MNNITLEKDYKETIHKLQSKVDELILKNLFIVENYGNNLKVIKDQISDVADFINDKRILEELFKIMANINFMRRNL